MSRPWIASVWEEPRWPVRAARVRAVLGEGMPLDQAAGELGMGPGELSRWLTALVVYESLDTAGWDPAARAALEADEGPAVLYVLRNLPHPERDAAARYLAGRNLSVALAEELVQALKDCRRVGQEAGYGCRPGDALAWRRWRQAQDHPDAAARERLRNEALALSETRAMREQLEGNESPAVHQPHVPVHRWDPGGAWPRLIPYRSGVETGPVPETAAGGPAHVPAGAYVALPAWPELTRLRRPLAVPCPAFLAPGVPEGQAVLVAETAPATDGPHSWSLVRGEGGWNVVRAGREPPGTWAGRVVMVVRLGPDPEDVDEAAWSEGEE